MAGIIPIELDLDAIASVFIAVYPKMDRAQLVHHIATSEEFRKALAEDMQTFWVENAKAHPLETWMFRDEWDKYFPQA